MHGTVLLTLLELDGMCQLFQYVIALCNCSRD